MTDMSLEEALKEAQEWLDSADTMIADKGVHLPSREILRTILNNVNNHYRVELTLDTTMWNEGFDKAAMPWLRLYTTNGEWIAALPESYRVKNHYSPFDQEFTVEITKVPVTEIAEDTMPKLWREGYPDEAADELQAGIDRFPGLVEGSSDELNELIQERLSDWDGV